MILFGLILLCAIVIGGIVGMIVAQDAGYVLVAYAGSAVETSLWVAVLVLIGGYLLLRTSWKLIRSIIESQGQVLRWRSGRRGRKARQQTVRGLLLMAEGRWEESKKTLLGAVRNVETPLINYLNAARAAHELGLTDERDQYLRRAHETTPGAKFAAMLSQAEFRINDGSYEQALAALLPLRKRAPKHKAVLRMLAQCYEALGDWQALQGELRELIDRKAVSDAESRRLSRLVWAALLKGQQTKSQEQTVSTDQDVAGLWKRLPKPLKSDQALLREWVAYLVQSASYDAAEHAIRLILGHAWDAELVSTYGELRSSDVPRQLLTVQGWLKERPNDVALMLALGALCMADEQHEKSRTYFESALRIDPRPEVYAQLGRVCIILGDEKRGTDYLLQSVGDLPALRSASAKPAADTAASGKVAQADSVSSTG